MSDATDQLAATQAELQRLRADLRAIRNRPRRRLAVFCRSAWRGFEATWGAVICDALEVWVLEMICAGITMSILCTTPTEFAFGYFLFAILSMPMTCLAVLMLNNREYP